MVALKVTKLMDQSTAVMVEGYLYLLRIGVERN
jgi:hypothetical protein